MIFALASKFHVYLPCLGTRLAYDLSRFLNVKALLGAFNQEKAIAGAFSVIVQPVVEPLDSFTALPSIPITV